jgi:hypothetical protein
MRTLVLAVRCVVLPVALAVGLALAGVVWTAYIRWDGRQVVYSDDLPPETVAEMEALLQDRMASQSRPGNNSLSGAEPAACEGYAGGIGST